MKRVSPWLAVAALAGWTINGVSSAKVPPPNISVVVEGVGFDYPPPISAVSCRGETCSLSIVVSGIRHEIVFPADLKYFGAGCERALVTSDPSPFSATTGSFETSAAVLQLSYHGDCPSRQIVERFSVVNPVEARTPAAAYYIAGAVGRWRVCTLRTRDGYACGASQALSLHANNASRRASIETWLREAAR